tara:strand:+ start:103 stop:486 length:384 start_codon:yes stop_codon:yes gene_type:complete
MAHFAKIEDGIVVNVVVVGNDDITDENGDEQESLGQAFLNNLLGEGTWVQTSYNHNFRKQFAGKGMTYDADKDKFIDMRPYPSWSLDKNDEWKPPIPYMPSAQEGEENPLVHEWNEDAQRWQSQVRL